MHVDRNKSVKVVLTVVEWSRALVEKRKLQRFCEKQWTLLLSFSFQALLKIEAISNSLMSQSDMTNKGDVIAVDLERSESARVRPENYLSVYFSSLEL